MTVTWKTALAALLGGTLAGPASAQAQSCASCAPAAMPVTSYRLDYQTVYEERQTTGYRIEHETQ